MSQTDLARKSGLAVAQVNKYANGRQTPDLENLFRIAHAAGVSPGWLAFGDGPDPAAVRELSAFLSASTASMEAVLSSQREAASLLARMTGTRPPLPVVRVRKAELKAAWPLALHCFDLENARMIGNRIFADVATDQLLPEAPYESTIVVRTFSSPMVLPPHKKRGTIAHARQVIPEGLVLWQTTPLASRVRRMEYVEHPEWGWQAVMPGQDIEPEIRETPDLLPVEVAGFVEAVVEVES